MAKVSNKHKAQGKKPVVVKESWWTPQRVKMAVAAVVAAAVIILAVACFNYVSGLQDSVVGTWSHEYTDSMTEEAMEVELVFNKDMTCSFTRSREGEVEANMSGSYSIDDKYDVISLMLGADMSTVLQYYYDCDGDALEMKNFTSGQIDNYVKVNK
jgi:hypothetical protein